nr:uncharacterized protein LOC107761697 [Ipomoea batatas]
MARLEGSIAEGYIAKVCMTLCSRYLKSIRTKFNRLERNNDGGSYTTNAKISIFLKPGRALGASEDGKFGGPVFVTSNKMVEINIEDLKWLVTNKFMTEKFQDEIVKTIMSNPSLLNLEVVEKHFGKRRHDHVYGYGGGVKRNFFNDSKSTYIKDLEAKLHENDEENRNLNRRMDVFDSSLIRIENGDLPSLGTTTSDDIQEVDKVN